MNSCNAQKAYSKLLDYSVTLDGSWWFGQFRELISIINEALGLPAPDGNPSVISEVGNAYIQAGNTLCNGVLIDLGYAASGKFPAACGCDAAKTASQEVSGLAYQSYDAGVAIYNAGQALVKWADQLQQAQRSDASGRASLRQAYNILCAVNCSIPSSYDHEQFAIALELVRDGVNSMESGAFGALSNGQIAADIAKHAAGHATKPEPVACGGSCPSVPTPRQPVGSQLISAQPIG